MRACIICKRRQVSWVSPREQKREWLLLNLLRLDLRQQRKNNVNIRVRTTAGRRER